MKIVRKIPARMAAWPAHFISTGGYSAAAATACGYPGSAADLGNEFLQDDRTLALVVSLIRQGVPGSAKALDRLQMPRRSEITKAKVRRLLEAPDIADCVETENGFIVVMDEP